MKKISLSVVCPMASCTRSNTCARYAQYVKALTSADTFEVLNVKHLQCEGEKCPYHLVSEKQVWARGFQRIYSTIPAGRTHYFYSRTPYARRRFYKAKNGEIAIDPDMQQHLISIFREHGADMSIGFEIESLSDALTSLERQLGDNLFVSSDDKTELSAYLRDFYRELAFTRQDTMKLYAE